jgi:hypothetical protein
MVTPSTVISEKITTLKRTMQEQNGNEPSLNTPDWPDIAPVH